MKKYIFIQNDPFYLPRVLDSVLEVYGDSVVGVNIQSVAQGKRTVFGTAMDLLKLYGFRYFQWKLRQYLWCKVKAKVVNGWMGRLTRCYSVGAVARKHGVEVTEAVNVNSDEFRSHLREHGVEFIVSISGTQFYGKRLREQTSAGIVNCHGALLPNYRGLMPSFWTLANGETEGGVSVHFVNEKLDDGPIVVQRRYPIDSADTLEDVMARSKKIAAEAIIECIRLVEAGDPPLMDNPEEGASHYSMPTREDVRRFREHGHRFA
ncbi:MAG: formyltransferase family protein [Phycisphaerales bacterium]|nr:formyltransferase family protein [Phycisphaerales bacterium]|tara:strand:- start:27968 stop:28756 length:789 start_codon:yes stop_codon:yes gene_type:complete